MIFYSADTTADRIKKEEMLEEKKRQQREKEQREKIAREERAKKREELNKVRKIEIEIKKSKQIIYNYKKEINNITKQINILNNNLISTYDQAKIDEIIAKRDALIMKRYELKDKIVEEEIKIRKLSIDVVNAKDKFVVADGTLNWKKEYIIADRKKFSPGTWSVTVKAKDNNENWSREEAINISIDPKSDIPSLYIINPTLNARVTGNLKIVGTARDDDAIDRVELLIDQENTKRVAEGKEFWYYDLDTSGMKDGVHRIRVKCYDINGVPSKDYETYFQLDRRTPFVDITTMKAGQVVSGKMNIGGTIADDNGIVLLEYSIDERESWSRVVNVRSLAKGNVKVGWQFELDSKLLVDGISTVWVRGMDKTGSYGYAPLTVTVDHKKPEIFFQYPTDKSTVDGRFTAFGFASDNVDIKEVTFMIAGPGVDSKAKPQKVEILPGNPFWSHPVDMSKLKSGNYKLTVTVVDIANNVSTVSINVTLDDKLDKPQIILSKEGDTKDKKDKSEKTEKELRVCNSILLNADVYDDDGMKEVIVEIKKDGNKESILKESVPSVYSFSKDIYLDKETFKDGKYVAELTPVDINNTKGDTVLVPFIIDRNYPKFDIPDINKKVAGQFLKSIFELKDIKVIKNGDLESVKYSLIDPDTNKVIIKERDLKFSESKKKGEYDVEAIKEDLSKEKFNDKIFIAQIKAIDKNSRVATLSVPIIVDFKSPEIIEPKIDSKIGMIKDDICTIKDNLVFESVKVDIISSDKNEREIKNRTLKLEEDNEFDLKVKTSDGKFNEYNITITAVDIAKNETKKQFKINFKDTKQTKHKLTFKVQQGSLIKYTEPKLFGAKDIMGIDEISNVLYLALPEGVTDPKLVNGNIIIDGIPINNQKANIYSLYLSENDIRDYKIGKNSVKITSSNGEAFSFDLVYDKEDPANTILWPPSNYSFNNDIFIYAIGSDDSNEIVASYSINSDKNFVDVEVEPIANIKKYNVPMLEPLKRDKSENLEAYLKNNNIATTQKDKLFKIEIPLTKMKEGNNTIFVKVKDFSGKENVKKIVVNYDKKSPEVKVWTPKDKESVNGLITIRGEAKDNNFLTNVVVMFNGEERIANGRDLWEALYNFNEVKGLNLKIGDKKDFTIELFAIDAAGNKTNINKEVVIDTETDAPVVFINNPSVNGQRYTDFVEIAGLALDDDGIAYVQYRIHQPQSILDKDVGKEPEWERVEIVKGTANWYKKIPKDALKPGKHTLEVMAVDIYGAKSESKKIDFHIDNESPVITIQIPKNGEYLRGEVSITGRASDPNGIEKVEISTNYGWTFSTAEGKESWKYYFDSNSVPDGQLRVLIRARDLAGSESFSFILYNIDNTKPEIDILLPKDGMVLNNTYRIVGRAKDNVGIDTVKLYVDGNLESKNRIYGTEEEGDDKGFFEVEGDKEAWYFDIDTNNLVEKDKYQLIAKVRDFAGNESERSLNFKVAPASDLPSIIIDQPQPGQHLVGEILEIFGTAYDDDGIESVHVKIDDGPEMLAKGQELWSFYLSTVGLTPGEHKLVVVAKEKQQEGKPQRVITQSRIFYYDEGGPVVEVTSHRNGAPMEHRPWLKGKSYYYERDLDLKLKKEIQQKKYNALKRKYRREPEKLAKIEIDKIPVKKYEVDSLKSNYLKKNRVKAIYLSLDNGKTYEKHLGPAENWITRVQTQYLIDGTHVLQIKAVTESGKEIIKYFRVQINRNLPQIIIDTPREGDKINDKFVVRGSANDDGKVEEVKILFRQFDKNLGKVPKFIQGLYLWAEAFGGPTVSGGFGLSFFEDKVRIEGMVGWTATRRNMADMGTNPDDIEYWRKWGYLNGYRPRFSGLAVGGKLWAQILDIPWEFFFGEDARQFSTGLSIGSAFFWFTGFSGDPAEFESEENIITKIDDSGNEKIVFYGKVISGFMYQIDLFRIERIGPFRKFAIFFEHAFYFNASEVEGGIIPPWGQFGFGIRNAFF